jgi:nucleoside-diphosphate-sugar epimerase
MKSSYLITGASGFIGAWVVKQLLSEGAAIVMFDLSADTRRLRLLVDDEILSLVPFVAGDITQADSLAHAVEHYGVERIIHLAGLQVPTCRADPRAGALANVIGTINVFEAARRASGQVKKVVYASSAAVFGHPEDDHPVGEGHPTAPTTHYGVFKLCNEGTARVYYGDHGMDSIGLRPLTVYGVGRDHGQTADVTKAMKAAVVGRPYHIRFGGKTDLLYAADAATVFIRAATSELTGAHVFNVHGETYHLAEVVAEIERAWPGAKGTITSTDTPLPIPAHLDDSAIRAALGPLPVTPLAQAVRETVERFAGLHREGRLETSDLEE